MSPTTTTDPRPEVRPCGCARGVGLLPSHVQSVLGYSPAELALLNLRGELLEHGDGTVCPDSLTRVMAGVAL